MGGTDPPAAAAGKVQGCRQRYPQPKGVRLDREPKSRPCSIDYSDFCTLNPDLYEWQEKKTLRPYLISTRGIFPVGRIRNGLFFAPDACILSVVEDAYFPHNISCNTDRHRTALSHLQIQSVYVSSRGDHISLITPLCCCRANIQLRVQKPP